MSNNRKDIEKPTKDEVAEATDRLVSAAKEYYKVVERDYLTAKSDDDADFLNYELRRIRAFIEATDPNEAV